MSKDYKNIHYFLMTYSDWRKKIDVELPNGYDEWLDEITTFNLNARYDDYKQSFHKLCTIEFANEWLDKIETLRKWLIKQL